MRRQPLDQRDKARIDKEQPVRGVIDYVDDLVFEQPRVDRVADRADARDRVIELEMAKGVPGECPDAVAGSDPQPQQRASEPLGSALGLAVGIAVDRAFDSARDDFRVAMIARRMFDDRRDQERPLRHQSPHRLLPYAILTVIAGQFDTDARSLFRRGQTCKPGKADRLKGQ